MANQVEILKKVRQEWGELLNIIDYMDFEIATHFFVTKRWIRAKRIQASLFEAHIEDEMCPKQGKHKKRRGVGAKRYKIKLLPQEDTNYMGRLRCTETGCQQHKFTVGGNTILTKMHIPLWCWIQGIFFKTEFSRHKTNITPATLSGAITLYYKMYNGKGFSEKQARKMIKLLDGIRLKCYKTEREIMDDPFLYKIVSNRLGRQRPVLHGYVLTWDCYINWGNLFPESEDLYIQARQKARPYDKKFKTREQIRVAEDKCIYADIKRALENQFNDTGLRAWREDPRKHDAKFRKEQRQKARLAYAIEQARQPKRRI